MAHFLIGSKHRCYLILSVLGLISPTVNCSQYPSFVVCTRQKRLRYTGTKVSGAPPPWAELENALGVCFHLPATSVSIDSVLDPAAPTFSTERPTLFRERHGWCPYSERVWLTLELNEISHDTIRIDNTGGPRPSYYGGLTPQMKWPDGKLQGESMDLVSALDSRYECQLQSDDSQVIDCISQFRNIYPRARPSSRAAFLFQNNGDPLSRGTFEATLQGTDDLLSQTKGAFFCGDQLTAADIAWAPFLERYRYQLPCLHEGLEPYNANAYPHLASWYKAMDQVPAYACRVKGDASSWRKVLTMAGFGNAGVPGQVGRNMQDLATAEAALAASGATINLGLWKEYAGTRRHVADTPQGQAALTILCNREAIIRDAVKRAATAPWSASNLPKIESEVEAALKGLIQVLLDQDIPGDDPLQAVGALAGFLDERMCVPRDMGAMSAACLKKVAWDLQQSAV
jgi:glutathione S-transferase